MSRTSFDTLLEAGCHFGHLKRKWNPVRRLKVGPVPVHQVVELVTEKRSELQHSVTLEEAGVVFPVCHVPNTKFHQANHTNPT